LKSLNKKADKSLVLLGRVNGAHGIKGELKIRPYSGEPQSLLGYKCLLLTDGATSESVAWNVEQARAHKSWAVIKLAGCDNRDRAEQLYRAEVFVRADELPELDEGEFYLRELEGRAVRTVDGHVVGTITGLLAGGAQDILQVENSGQEYLIPLVPEFIVAMDADAVTVSLPPGLLEINA
jgi:16S rRNA processing protein RimM